MSTTETQSKPSIPAAVLGAALALDEAQRLALGYELLDSVEDDPNDPHPGWRKDWREELSRRSLAVEQGAPTFSMEEVEAHIREALLRGEEVRRNREAGKS